MHLNSLTNRNEKTKMIQANVNYVINIADFLTDKQKMTGIKGVFKVGQN